MVDLQRARPIFSNEQPEHQYLQTPDVGLGSELGVDGLTITGNHYLRPLWNYEPLRTHWWQAVLY